MWTNTDFILDRAADELGVNVSRNKAKLSAMAFYIRLFGVPEIGLFVRTRAVLRALKGSAGSLIDLGCGAGFLLGAVARRRTHDRLVGIDIDAESVAVAQKTHPDAIIAVGDACADNLMSGIELGSFDAAVSVDVIEHIESARLNLYLANAYKLLKPGGTLILHVPRTNQRRHLKRFKGWAHHDHVVEGYDVTELQLLLTNSGFVDSRMSGTFGWYSSLAWEINMTLAGGLAQALAYPLLALFCILDDWTVSASHNGSIVVANKPQSASTGS